MVDVKVIRSRAVVDHSSGFADGCAVGFHLSAREFTALADMRKHLHQALTIKGELLNSLALSQRAYEALLMLRARPTGDPATISDLSRELSIKNNSIVGLVDRLEHRGFLRRSFDGPDRRQTTVNLTAKGCEVVEVIAAFDYTRLQNILRILDQRSVP